MVVAGLVPDQPLEGPQVPQKGLELERPLLVQLLVVRRSLLLCWLAAVSIARLVQQKRPGFATRLPKTTKLTPTLRLCWRKPEIRSIPCISEDLLLWPRDAK